MDNGHITIKAEIPEEVTATLNSVSEKLDKLINELEGEKLSQTDKGLPPNGLSKFADFAHLIGMGKSTWHWLIQCKRAPQPIRIDNTAMCLYKNDEINRFLANPNGYRPFEADALSDSR